MKTYLPSVPELGRAPWQVAAKHQTFCAKSTCQAPGLGDNTLSWEMTSRSPGLTRLIQKAEFYEMYDRMRTRSCTSAGFAVLLSVGMVGCGDADGLDGVIPIRGTVVYQGKPLENGEVRYLPLDRSDGRVARGPIDSRGRFRLTTLQNGDGAMPGGYRIVVVVYAEQFDDIARRENDEDATFVMSHNKPPIPARYYKPDTSGLTDNVNGEHNGFKEIILVD